jgi:hypothetical protein
MAHRTPANIDRKIDQIKEMIRAEFHARGEAQVDVQDIRISLDEWRKLARSVARELGRPVQTVASDTRAWAVLRDWPRDDREKHVHDEAMRKAMNAAALSFPIDPRQ